MAKWNRRRVLQGMLAGSAVSVALPLLDCLLDDNGRALASGAPIPTRFGVWFWGCGVDAARWFPDKVGTDFEFKASSAPLAEFKKKLTIFSGYNVILAGKPSLMHWSGVMGTLTGAAPTQGGVGIGSADAPTIDCLVADAIGSGTRFRSLEAACTGRSSVSYSMRTGATVNPSEVEPIGLYKRLFGLEFQDPNAGVFTPDPALMLRQSVLSSIKDEREKLLRSVGSTDRARVDEYFTSLRDLETQMATMLEKPAPAAACAIPKAPGKTDLGPTWEMVAKNHTLLGQLMVMALACNQTRVFNMALSNAASDLRQPGSPVSFHELTHTEPVDAKLGIQPQSTFFKDKSMTSLAEMLRMLDAVREGDGTLLDHSLMLATSDTNDARIHSIDSLPIVVAGGAGGKWRGGQHIDGHGDPSSRVGLTIQQALGMPVGTWGSAAMQTSRPISDVLA